MNKLKKIVVFCIITIFISVTSFSFGASKKLIVFKTYTDFKAKKGDDLGKMKTYTSFEFGRGTFNFILENDKKINAKGYWGFSLEGYLFRFQNGIPYFVYSSGKIIYYEHGKFHLRMFLEDETSGSIWAEEKDYFRSFSKDLTSQIYPDKKIKKFAKEVPESIEIIECIRKKVKPYSFQKKIDSGRSCIKNLN